MKKQIKNSAYGKMTFKIFLNDIFTTENTYLHLWPINYVGIDIYRYWEEKVWKNI